MPNIKLSYIQGNIQMYHGNNLEVMPGLEPNSIDTIITDPPYALEFMGKEWDKVLPAKETWIECLRVAKPGAMMLVFGGDRTHHRLMVDIEDAGWEIRTCIYWIFGSGFPKSLDIGKAIDKMRGAERDVVGINEDYLRRKPHGMKTDGATAYGYSKMQYETNADITAPATLEAQLWDGWGTALKPAAEIIVVAMKPLDGSFSQNALKWGVGGLNIDGSRIQLAENDGDNARPNADSHNLISTGHIKHGALPGKDNAFVTKGRFPANLILSHLPECREVGVKKVKGTAPIGPKGGKNSLLGSGKPGSWLTDEKRRAYNDPDGTETVEAWECVEGCPVRMLDEQSGTLQSGLMKAGTQRSTDGGYHGDFPPTANLKDTYADSGGASRFFYCAKASRSEREQGLKGHIPCVKCSGLDTDFHLDDKDDKVKCVRNNHPTVKSLAIMKYLCKLTMTPTGGIVLDMFGGTGTTALACENIGRKCILIEKEKKSCDIAIARLKGLTKQGRLWDA